MTDTEIKRRRAICKAAHVDEIDDVSDGFHTFRQLYYQRMMLFATIVKQNRDRAWKSLRHEDGELCFGGGWFIVGIDTPEGSYTYHYENKYWDMFDCADLPRAKHWDGHTEKDVTRLLSLPSPQPEPLTDKEQRIFLAAMAREEKVCKEVDRNYVHEPYEGQPYASMQGNQTKGKGCVMGRKMIYLDEAIDAIENVPDHGDGMIWEALSHAQRDVSLLPSAQTEIIRCLECKHYDDRPCGIVNWYNTADDFCSRAERRTDE